MKQDLSSEAVFGSASASRIGVFDSGVGGLTVLRALARRLPEAPLAYIGDVAYAPYGERSAADLARRCLVLTERLVDDGADLLVIACNTATVLAIDALRARWPRLQFVGVEPGVKMAATVSATRRVAVMATPATAASHRLHDLIARHAVGLHVHVQPCPALAPAIEAGVVEGSTMRDVLQPYCDAIRAAQVDTVVLACTHYPFAETSIRALLGEGVRLVDTTAAIAERTASLCNLKRDAHEGPRRIRIASTGATGPMQRLLGRCAGLGHLDVETVRL